MGLMVFISYLLLNQPFTGFCYSLLCGYGCAWFGHFFIEKNKPATFIYPKWSYFGDFVMFY